MGLSMLRRVRLYRYPLTGCFPWLAVASALFFGRRAARVLPVLPFVAVFNPVRNGDIKDGPGRIGCWLDKPASSTLLGNDE
jgi:hypothetical protein